MKKSMLFLTCVFLFPHLHAQTKDLPRCKNIKEKLLKVSESFDSIVTAFASKEDKISLIKTYFSEFSICEEKGKITDYGRNVEFIFTFSDADYKGSRDNFRDFYKKVFKKVKEAFDSTHVYKISKEQSSKSCYFYEKDKEITTSKRNIKMSLSYKDPVDETTAYSVMLIFEYYPKR
jgi:hypothetical protein